MPLLPDICAVLFDWGDTLVRPPGVTTDEAGHLACVEAVFRTIAAEPRLGSELAGHHIDWRRFKGAYLETVATQIRTTRETGREHSFADRLSLSFAAAGLPRPLDPAEARALAAALADRIIDACRPIEGAAQALQRLAERYRIGLLSNYPEPRVVRESLVDLDHDFDPFMISGEIGWAKPHPEAFAACLDRLGCAAARVLYVGDDPTNDIVGAHQFGFRTCWIERAGQPPPTAATDLSLASVAKLAELLER